MKNLLFWQNALSIHQAPFLHSLAPLWASRFGGDLRVISEADLPKRRKAAGWSAPDYGEIDVQIITDRAQRDDILKMHASRDNIHVFSGFDMTRLNQKILDMSLELDCHSIVMLERPRTDQVVKGFLRKMKYSVYAYKYRNVDALLAMSSLGCRYYASCGFPDEKLIPFGYFTQRNDFEANKSEHTAVNICFVGNSSRWKGLDVYLSALNMLTLKQDWRAHVVGVGCDAVGEFQNLYNNVGDHKITCHGAMNNEALNKFLLQMDIVVVPSRYDGWGAVTNEALQAGARVIVSDAAGSSDLVRAKNDNNWRGSIFCSEDVIDLSQHLSHFIETGVLKAEQRHKIKEWSLSAIDPNKAAQYFCNIVAFVNGELTVKPQVPWA